MLRFLSRMSLYIVGSQLRTAVEGKSLRPLKKGEWVEFSCNFTLQKLVKIYGIKGGFVRLLLAAIFKLALRTNERRKKGLLFYKVAKKSSVIFFAYSSSSLQNTQFSWLKKFPSLCKKSNISAFKLLSINQDPADLFQGTFSLSISSMSMSPFHKKWWNIGRVRAKHFFNLFHLDLRTFSWHTVQCDLYKKDSTCPFKTTLFFEKIDGNNEFLKRVL